MTLPSTGGERMDNETAGRHQCYASRGSGRRIPKQSPAPLRRRFGRIERVDIKGDVRPIFSRGLSAFSSIVVRPPAMLPLVGCEVREVIGLVRLG